MLVDHIVDFFLGNGLSFIAWIVKGQHLEFLLESGNMLLNKLPGLLNLWVSVAFLIF